MDTNYDVFVVANYDEALILGAHFRDGRYVMPNGATVVSVTAGPRSVEGMRVGDVESTAKARRHWGFERVAEALRMSQEKMRR